MKKLIFSMIILIASTFTINVHGYSYWDFDLTYGNQSTFNVQDQQIDMTYSTSGSTGTYSYYLTYDFYQTFQGLAIYDYDGNGPLGNGTLNNGYYKITSGVNSAFRYLYIGYLEFDIYQYNYDFEVVKTSSSLTIYWTDTNDPKYEDLSGNDVDVVISGIDLDDWYLMIYNELYLAEQEAYRQNGVIEGYEDGKVAYGYLLNGEYVSATYWGQSEYARGIQYGLTQNMDYTVIGNNIASGMAGILGISIGGITLGALVLIPLSFSLFMWFIKVVRK